MASVRAPCQKLILCGEFGVGKSSIFRRFMSGSFINSQDRKSTLGLDHFHKVYKVNEKDVKLQLWDTGGMERIASVTSSYYKFSEAAILVFALDKPDSFHSLSQHMLDVVTYAENAKIFLCGNRSDLENEVSDADMEEFCVQCQSLISSCFKISCKTGEGVEEMFQSIANTLVESNRSRIELQTFEQHGFKIQPPESSEEQTCLC